MTPSAVGVIPIMTSATTSGFTISASTSFSASYAAWLACDGNNLTDWAMSGNGFPSTWQVSCPQEYVIWQIQVSKRASVGEWIDTFYFEGSKDGSTWVSLAYSTGQMSAIGSVPSVLTVTINDLTYTAYSYFRMRNTAGTGPNPGFAIFQMYAYTQANTTATGATGSTGPQGIAGSATLTGATGPTGPLGVPAWISAGAITLTATTTSPTKGVIAYDTISYRQLGTKQWEIVLTYSQTNTTGATSGSGDYLFTLPNSLQFDTTLSSQIIFTGNIGANVWDSAFYILPSGSGMINNNNVGGQVYPIIYDSTKFRILTITYGSAVQCWGSAFYQLAANNPKVQLTFRFTST